MHQQNSIKKTSISSVGKLAKTADLRRSKSGNLINPQIEELISVDIKKSNGKKILLNKDSSNIEGENIILDYYAATAASSESSSAVENAQTFLYAQSSTVASDASGSSAPSSGASGSGGIPTEVLVGLGVIGVAGGVAIAASSGGGSSSASPTPAPAPAAGISGTVADGYIRGARIYVDTNQNGVADPSEYTGVLTDADGKFVLPSGSPTGTIIAVGGTNIDTGLEQTTPLKAPAGSLIINPLTTLVQVLIENHQLTATEASAMVSNRLGITIPNGASLLEYDPIGAGDLVAQKSAVQLAVIFGIAESFDTAYDVLIADGIAELMQSSTARIDLSDSNTIKNFIASAPGTSLEIPGLFDKIVVGTKVIASAASMSDISANQLLLDISKAGGTANDNVNSNNLHSTPDRIENNPNFDYADFLIAGEFANRAYDNQLPGYQGLITKIGWQGISLDVTGMGTTAIDSYAGFGINDPINWLTPNDTFMKSFATAAKREAADGTVEYVLSFEGSGSPFSQPEDWLVNAGEYGWTRYYESLMPITTEVVREMMVDKDAGKNVSLILTGHSLGGAAASVAYADFFVDPTVNLWSEVGSPLASSSRLYAQTALDMVGWTDDEIRSMLIESTDVYTFGAPSFLIEPTKLSGAEFASFATSLAAATSISGIAGAIGAIAGISKMLTVDHDLVPALAGFEDHVFQLEHENSTWYLPADIVAKIGSEDAGTVLDANLTNDMQWSYAGALLYLVPGGTHGMGNYEETVARLISDSPVLKTTDSFADTSPLMAYTSTSTGTSINDHFLNSAGASGEAGNDLFVYTSRANYVANGGSGDDTYVLANYGIDLTVDGSALSGLDTLIFDLGGTISRLAGSFDANGVNDDVRYTITNGNANTASFTLLNPNVARLDQLIQINEDPNVNWTITCYDPMTGMAYPG